MARVDKRSRLAAAAVDLVHQHGFHSTTLAQVAEAAGVPLGNVYYYYKTKEALGAAVVDEQFAQHQRMRDQWDATLDPRQRMVAWVRTTAGNGAQLAERGCPMGSLCSELHKDRTPLAEHATAALFAAWLTWLEAQFRALGRGAESADLALHVLTVLQGASVVTHAFNEPAHMTREVDRLVAWIDEQAAAGSPDTS